MSMISAQIDELRNLAADANINGDTRYFCDPLEQAADTIWELRDDLQRANAENAKLREYAAKAWSLFIRHGAVHACDLSEVDAVRDGLRELGIEVG